MMNMRTKARTLLASLTLAAALSLPALGLPEGGQVVNGQVNIGSPLNGQMTIQQLTDHAIINWNAFGINATEMLRFVQPSQLSAILNRVTGQDPSLIMGSLQANGRVFIINPNGILFGAGSQVNVGSLFASTLNITDDNFLNDRFKFDQVDGKAAASIVNQGTLTVSPGGFLVLTAPLIANQGVIVANVGQVALAAGEHTEINFDGRGLINIQVDPAVAQVGPVAINNGILNNMVGNLLNISPADSITQLPGGVELAGASGRLVNTGEIHADALEGQSAGHIVLNSQQSTLVRDGSLISANGVGAVDGGSVKLLSNGLAFLENGAITQARGGQAGGNGGFVELSGKGRVSVQGVVDVSSVQGTAGVFLLDPLTLHIVNGVAGTGDQDPFIVTTTAGFPDRGGNTVTNGFINAFTAGTLTLQADNTITQDNNAPINNTNAGVNLVFQTTNGDISFNAGVATTGTITATAGQNVALNDNGNYFISGSSVTLTAGGTGSVASNNAGFHVVNATNSVNLTGPGGVFGPGFTPPNITGSSAFQTRTPVLNVDSSNGNIFVVNNAASSGALAVNATAPSTASPTTTGGAFIVNNNGSITVGSTGIRGSGLGTGVVTQNGGDILNDANSGAIGVAGSATEIKAPNIGTTAQPVKTAGSTVNLFSTGSTGVTVSQNGSAVFNLNVTTGPTNITSNGDVGISAGFNDALNFNNPTPYQTSGTSPLTITTTGKIENSGGNPILLGNGVNLSGTNGVGSLGALAVHSNSAINATSSAGAVSITSATPIVVGSSGIGGNAGTTLTATGGGANGDISTPNAGRVGLGGTTTITGHALGVVGTPLKTAGSALSFTATAGAVLQHNGSATVSGTATGVVDVDLTGNLAVGTAGIAGTTSTSLKASGDITGSTGTVGTSGTSTNLQGANVGTPGAAVKTLGNAITVTASAGVNLQQSGAATFTLANSGANSAVTIASDANIDIGGTFTHPSGALTLTTTNGHIQTSTVPLTGTSISLTAAGPITVDTAAASLNATATGASGSISLNNNQSATVNATASQAASVATTAGSFTVGSSGVSGANGATTLTAPVSIVAGTGRVGSAGQATFITAGTIGTTAAPVLTAGSTVRLSGSSVHASQQGASTFEVFNGAPGTAVSDVSIVSDSDLTLTAPPQFSTDNTSTVSLITTGPGSRLLLSTPFTLVGNSVTLSTVADLGSLGTPFATQASVLNASSTGGSVFVSNTGTVTAGGSAAVNYNLTNSAQTTLTSLTAGGVANINSTGNLLGNGGGTNLTAATANLITSGKIGTDSSNRLNTAAGTLNANGPSGVFIQNAGSTTATSVQSANGSIDLNVDGDLTLGLISAPNGTVKLQTCPNGSILDGNDGPGVQNNIASGGDVTLIAHGTVGTDADAIEVNMTGGVLRVAAGGQTNGTSFNVGGTTPSNSLEVFDPPAGTACFTGLPPGRGFFNGTQIYTPAAKASDAGGVAAAQQFFVPQETRQALNDVLVNPFTFNQPPFLDAQGRVLGSAFVPFYTSGLAFLLDKEDWLRFLQETVVWDIDEDEAKGI
ncbi:MAG: filamentous hemagglutinin N-terminal domain-containing protein [Vulcanimicrobiota bacterium]